jgi:hypothetical protein
VRRIRLIVAAAILVAAIPAIAVAGQGGGGRPDAASAAGVSAEHQRVVEFWTHARVAQAVPRDMVLDATGESVGFAPAHHTPGHCGGPPSAPKDCPGDTTTTTSTTTTTTTTAPDDGGGDTITLVTGARWTQGGDIAEASGKVLFALGSNYYVCSASVVKDTASDRSIVVTAAHCVYDETKDGDAGFAKNWVFIPNYDASPAPLSTSNDSYCADTEYGCWSAFALFVHHGYASQSSFDAEATRHDFGFAAVGLGGNVEGGKHLDATVTPLGIEFASVAINGTVQGWAFGYPAAKKYNGRELIHCANGITGDPYNSNTTYRMAECDMTGGSSGGPWLKGLTGAFNGTVISVNSYGYRGITAMHGPMFNAKTEAVYDAAKNEELKINTIVGGGS